MVENVGQQNEIVSKIFFNALPGRVLQSICNAGRLRIYLSQFPHVGPIDSGELRVGILFRDGVVIHPVAGGDIQFPARLSLRVSRSIAR